MTNKEIRKKAWELCKTHFWRLLGVTLFISLITAPFMIPHGAAIMSASNGAVLTGDAAAMSMISLLLMMILASILEAGLLQYISNLWNGLPANLFTLFAHARRVLRLIGIGLLTILCMYAVMLPGMLIVGLIMSLSPIIASIAIIALFVLLIHVLLRISPAMIAFVLDPSRTAPQCIKTAWRATEGNTRRIFCHGFMLMLPALAASLLIALLTPATGAYSSAIANTIYTVATLLFTALFTIYMQFGQYGLNELLLTSRSARSNVPAAELWDAAPILPESADEEYEETDEYEDIPESEQDNPDDHSESN